MNEQFLTVTMGSPAPNLDRAGRINYYHVLSRKAGMVSICAALAAGLELCGARDDCDVGMFESWLKKHCDFTKSTAYNYISLATKVFTTARLPKLLAAPEPEREAAIEATAESVDSRSLSELYVDLGIVKKAQSNLGGQRAGAGRPPKLLAAPTPEGDAIKMWTIYLDNFMRPGILDAAAFLPRGEAEGMLQQVDVIRDRLKNRIAECKASK